MELRCGREKQIWNKVTPPSSWGGGAGKVLGETDECSKFVPALAGLGRASVWQMRLLGREVYNRMWPGMERSGEEHPRLRGEQGKGSVGSRRPTRWKD